MPTQRIPLIASFENQQGYSSFYTPLILKGPYLKNGLVEKGTVDGELFVKTRPGIKLHDYDSNGVYGAALVQLGSYSSAGYLVTARGTGFYKQATSNLNPTLDTTNVHTITNNGPTTIIQLPDGEIFVKTPEEAFHYDGTTDTTISDADYPSTTCLGGAYLDGYIFVADLDGAIYNSDLADTTAWTATNVISANRGNDKAVWLGKHHDNIVLISTNSIEFFYDAANPSGSPLTRRTDVFYSSLGSLAPNLSGGVYINPSPITQLGEDIYFIGSEKDGSLGLYVISGFSVNRISTPYLDKLLALIASNYSAEGIMLCAYQVANHTLISISSESDTIDNVIIYDVSNRAITDISTNLTQFTGTSKDKLNITHIFNTPYKPANGATLTNDPAALIGLTRSGYLFTLTPNLSLDYDAYDTSTGYDIDLVIRTPKWDAGSRNYKFIYEIRLDSDFKPSDALSVDISWSDNDYESFTTARSIDLAQGSKLTRLGRAVDRAWQIEYSGQEYLQFYALETKFSVGSI